MTLNMTGLMKSIRNIMREDNGVNGDAQRIEQLGWMIFLKVFSDKEKELEAMSGGYSSPLPDEYHWDAWAGDDEGMTGNELLGFVDNHLFPDLRELDISSGNKRALILQEVFEGNHNYMKSGTTLRRVLNKLNEVDFNRTDDRHVFGDIYEGMLKELQSAGKSGEFYTPRAVTQFLTATLNPQLNEKLLDPACGTGGFLTCSIEHLKEQTKTAADRRKIQKNVRGWEYKPLPFLLATTNLILHDIEEPNLVYRDSLDRPLSDYKAGEKVDCILANPPFGGVVANGNEKNFPQTFRTKESADLFLVLMMRLLKDGGRAAIVLPDSSLTGDGVKQRIREKWLTECNLHTIIRLPNTVFKPYATVATNLLFFRKGSPTKHVWYYEHRLPEGQKSYSKTKPIRPEEFDPVGRWMKKPTASDQSWKVSIKEIRDRGWDLDIKNPNRKEEEAEHTTTELLDRLHTSFKTSDALLAKLKKTSLIPTTNPTRIGEFLKRIRRPVDIEDHVEYQLVTIKMHHKGIVPRTKKMGSAIGTKKMYRVKAGDFILSGIDARNGAFGIVPQELDGAVVTNDFWYFEVDESVIDKHLFLELTSTAWFDEICRLGSDGTTQRIRLQKEKFFNQEIPLPPMENQKQLLKRFADCNELEQQITQSKCDATNFKQFILAEAFGE